MTSHADSATKTRTARNSAISTLSILYVGLLVLLIAVLVSEQLFHWFLIPVVGCGLLLVGDVVKWLKNDLQLFDPIGITAVFGIHFFMVAPILHISWTHITVDAALDWRAWLGYMAIVNFVSLVIYRLTLKSASYKRVKGNRTQWILDKVTFEFVLDVAIVIAFILQLWVYSRMGGISGMIESWTIRDKSIYVNMGSVFTISESFPILLLMRYAYHVKRKSKNLSWWSVFTILLLFFILKMVFGGFRGSRSNTIWAILWAAGILHLWVKPLPKSIVLVGLAFVLIFMFTYGFYKRYGSDAIQTFEEQAFEEEGENLLRNVLLGDLSRSDIQAFTLHRVVSPYAEQTLVSSPTRFTPTNALSIYEPALGRTYIASVALFVPRYLWPDRPPTKTREGTIIQYGEEYYIEGIRQSTRVYGLSGEAMLNFSIFGVPIALAIFGYVVGRFHRFYKSLTEDDPRMLLIPLLCSLCIVFLSSDLDNTLYFMVKFGLVPFLVVWLGSKRVET